MLNIVRRAFEEPADGSNDPLSVFPNPGPMYLLINALAITAITYMASFKLLNVRKPSFIILLVVIPITSRLHLSIIEPPM